MEKKIHTITLQESDQLDILFWKTISPEQKLEAVQVLRNIYFEFKNANRERFQKIYKIVEQKRR